MNIGEFFDRLEFRSGFFGPVNEKIRAIREIRGRDMFDHWRRLLDHLWFPGQNPPCERLVLDFT